MRSLFGAGVLLALAGPEAAQDTAAARRPVLSGFAEASYDQDQLTFAVSAAYLF